MDDLRLEEWTLKLLERAFVWRRVGSFIGPHPDRCKFVGSFRFSLARYEVGSVRIDKLTGTTNHHPTQDMYYHNLDRSLFSAFTDFIEPITKQGKLVHSGFCHLFEISHPDFIAEVYVGDMVSPEKLTIQGLKHTEFCHLICSHFEFAGDARAYRNAVSLALLQCA